MRIDGHDRWMSRREIPPVKLFQDEILNIQLRDRNVAANAPPDLTCSHIDDFTHVLRRIQMRFELLIAPNRFERLDQVRRRNDFDSETPHEFDGPRIDT